MTALAAAARTEKSKSVSIGERDFILVSDDDYLNNMGAAFEPHMCRLFRSLLGPEHVAVDVGANIGCTALLFAQLAKEVHAFEPSPSTFRYLERNVQNSRLQNVVLHNLGLGRTQEELTLTFSPANRSGGFVSNTTQASKGHVVEEILIRPGDSLFEDRRVDFVKIDVEGFEGQVIEGLKNTIRRDRPIFVSELNHWCLNAFQRTSIPDFFDFMLGVFPQLYAVDRDKIADLRDADSRYVVMHQHIVHFKYMNLVGAFSRDQLARFLSEYSGG